MASIFLFRVKIFRNVTICATFMLKDIELRRPLDTDGMAVHQLVASCPPLDPNSVYCNLLQVSHFAKTSVAAVSAGELVGFISGYRVPQQPQTLFIWQVAVSEKARGVGLASHMLNHIVDSVGCEGVSFMETTITESNRASWALFEKFASQRQAELLANNWFEKDTHFAGQHDSEVLVKIGPFERVSLHD